MFGGPEAAVAKALERVAAEAGPRRVKAVQRLAEILRDDGPSFFAQVPGGLLTTLPDTDEVWGESLQVLRELVRQQPEFLVPTLPTLLDNLRRPDPVRRRALEVLRILTKRLPEPGRHLRSSAGATDAIALLVQLADDEDEAVRRQAVGILENLGLPGKEFAQGVASVVGTMERAESLGGDTKEAWTLLARAKEAMVQHGFEAFVMRAKKAELVARYAQKLLPLWRQDGAFQAAAMTSQGNLVALAAGERVSLMDRHGRPVWESAVAGPVRALGFSPQALGVVTRRTFEGFDLQGNRLFSVVLSADPLGLVPSERGEFLIALEDLSLLRIDITGAETWRNWTAQRVVALGGSSDGDVIVLSMGDHMLYAYDRNLMPLWKHAGGVWTTASVARAGAPTVGGSQGRDLVAVASTGMQSWRAQIEQPVLQAAINRPGTLVFATDGRYVYLFDRAGRPVWRIWTGEEVRSLAVDDAGIQLLVVTKSGTTLFENREGLRAMAENWSATAGDRVPETASLKAGLTQATEAFQRNDYLQGAELVRRAWQQVHDADRGRLESRSTELTARLEQVRAGGADTSKAAEAIGLVRKFLALADLELAASELGRAEALLFEAVRTHEAARVAAAPPEQEGELRGLIERAIEEIDEATAFGVESATAEALLGDLIGASDRREASRARAISRALAAHIEERRASMPAVAEYNYQRAESIAAKMKPSVEEVGRAKNLLSVSTLFYRKTGNLRRMAVCYERLGDLERHGDRRRALLLYRKALDCYLDAGDMEGLAVLVNERLRGLGAEGGRPSYAVDDIFLLYKDGRMVAHTTRRLNAGIDQQLLGGMLVAIQGFANEGLGAKEGGELDEIKYGRTRLMLEKGNYLILALVVEGGETRLLRERMRAILQEIEGKYRATLKIWDGDLAKMWGVCRLVEAFSRDL